MIPIEFHIKGNEKFWHKTESITKIEVFIEIRYKRVVNEKRKTSTQLKDYY